MQVRYQTALLPVFAPQSGDRRSIQINFVIVNTFFS